MGAWAHHHHFNTRGFHRVAQASAAAGFVCTAVTFENGPWQCPTPPQIKLLKLLALLGAGDQAASENMYQVVATTMREGAKHGNTIGNALVYEAVRTVTAIYPNPTLLQQGESL